jgi:hypothetical protein
MGRVNIRIVLQSNRKGSFSSPHAGGAGGRLYSRLVVLAVSFMLFSTLVHAQTGTITGTISLPDTADWSGVTVVIDGRDVSTETDYTGYFEFLNVQPGTAKIKAGKLYYANADTSITITGGDAHGIDLSLTKSIVDTFSALHTPKLTTAVTNTGNIGVPGKFVEQGDYGFSWHSVQQLKEASFMIGIDPTRVSDAARFIFAQAQDNLDRDFLSLSDIVTLASGTDSTVQVTAFDDSRSNAAPGNPSRPLGVSIRQTTYAYGDAPNSGYLIVRMNIRNDTRFTLTNLIPGWFVDWQVDAVPNTNRGELITATQQIAGVNRGLPFPVEIAYQRASTRSGPFMGIAPLSQSRFKAARISSVAKEILPTAPNGGLTEANKYNYMSANRDSMAGTDLGIEEDLCTIVSVGGLGNTDFESSTFTLGAGGEIEIGFAFVGGSDSLEMIANALNAQRKWISLGHSIILYPNSWDVIEGWNLVSLPVIAPDLHPNVLFPNAASAPYYFFHQSGYAPSDSIFPGQGYWLKFPSVDSIVIDGSLFLAETVSVSAGWTILGSLSYPVPVSNIVTVPAGIIMNDIYGYNDGYYTTTILQPFQGYWFKFSQDGQVILKTTK